MKGVLGGNFPNVRYCSSLPYRYVHHNTVLLLTKPIRELSTAGREKNRSSLNDIWLEGGNTAERDGSGNSGSGGASLQAVVINTCSADLLLMWARPLVQLTEGAAARLPSRLARIKLPPAHPTPPHHAPPPHPPQP